MVDELVASHITHTSNTVFDGVEGVPEKKEECIMVRDQEVEIYNPGHKRGDEIRS
jgi:hypothetical protein